MFFNLLKKILLLIKIPFVLTNNKFKKNLFLFLLFISSFVGFDCSALCESISEAQSEIISPLEVEENIDYKKYFIYAVGGIALLIFLYYLNGFYSPPSVPPNLLNNDVYANINILGKIRAIDVIQSSETVYFQIDKFSKTIQYCSMDFNEFCNIADQLNQVAVLDIRSFTAITSHTYYNLISGMDMIHIINEYGLTFPK